MNEYQTKNEVIKLHLTTELSQGAIGKSVGLSQPQVSKIISAYKKGDFIYNDLTVPEQSSSFENLAECEQTVATNIETTEALIPTSSEPVEVIYTDEANTDQLPNEIESAEYEETEPSLPTEIITQPIELPPVVVAECEQETETIDTAPANSNSYQTKNTAECEQENSISSLNKSKITFTDHGLWLNQFALMQLNNPTELAYSFDIENLNLYIEPFSSNNVNPFYYCKAKCSKNYTKTANKQLINDIQEILELEFKGNVNINLNKDSFKIHFNFKFENGQFIINIPTMISKIDFETR